MCLQKLGPRASPSALVFPKHEQGGVGRCVETGHWGGTEEAAPLCYCRDACQIQTTRSFGRWTQARCRERIT